MKLISVPAVSLAVLALPSAVNAQAYVQLESGVDSISVTDSSNEGILYGIAAGYELPVGKTLFVGLEANFNDSSAKIDVTRGVQIVPGLFIGNQFRYETKQDISATIHLGALIDDRTRAYVLGGYTNSRLKITRFQAINNTSQTSISLIDNLGGYRIGAGIRRDFGSKFYGRIEYRYSNYEGDLSRHNGIVGLGLRF